jgi:16S rRNA (cytosine967-C5)-methyltransferase
LKDARRAAADALLSVERGAYANLALKDELPNVPAEHRSFCSALVYTALEHQIYLDWVIAKFTKGSVKPAARIVLRLGLCQALLMGVPESAAVNESVRLMKAMGKPALAGFVNGVLRAALREKGTLTPPSGKDAASLSIRTSTPEWIVKTFVERFGPELAEELLSSSGEKGSIRVNTLKADVESVQQALGFSTASGRFVPEVLRFDSAEGDLTGGELFQKGLIALQSEASALVCKAANPKPGQKVLDACAAPGGKTAALAAIAKNGANITAWDVHPHRVELIKATCERLGAANVTAEVKDASVYDAAYEKQFDVVLIDAPCSGLGVAGKPDLKLKKAKEDVTALSNLQLAILSACSKYVKPGGVLVYSTCTISKPENEDVTDAFLAAHPDFYPGDLTPFFPVDFDQSRLLGGRVQLLPPVDGVNGFYLARMHRK